MLALHPRRTDVLDTATSINQLACHLMGPAPRSPGTWRRTARTRGSPVSSHRGATDPLR
ncbi:hypothetical protein G7085_02285 [Tessaracoccus sp. HDW20]|uniref:hypothetical protein n=1 Tax=Tessaracoccus coleopterorum TaxID=2714950 RepID=UPI0018D39DEC|nr:hypothetical protein [Tessaracoccus coleopterorum]NHB83895.1 hypothetical protein [Tessaracoccus coleopterorum]